MIASPVSMLARNSTGTHQDAPSPQGGRSRFWAPTHLGMVGGWWFQYMQPSNWIISPGSWLKTTCLSCHHLNWHEHMHFFVLVMTHKLFGTVFGTTDFVWFSLPTSDWGWIIWRHMKLSWTEENLWASQPVSLCGFLVDATCSSPATGKKRLSACGTPNKCD